MDPFAAIHHEIYRDDRGQIANQWGDVSSGRSCVVYLSESSDEDSENDVTYRHSMFPGAKNRLLGNLRIESEKGRA